MRVALDTNILAYAEGVGDEARCQGARTLITELIHRDVVLPAQTLGELSRVLSAKSQRDPAGTRQAVLEWADCFFVADSTWACFQSALDLTVDHQLQIWDALILAVAAEHRCRLLLSEDFQDGFTWRGVTVVNPFHNPPSSLLRALMQGSARS